MTCQERTELSELIKEGKLAEAIDKLLTIDLNNSSRKEALSISYRYKKLSRQNRLGILSFEQANITENQIVNHFIDLVEHPEDEPYPEEKSIIKIKPAQPIIWKYTTTAVVIVGILASVFNFTNIIPSKKPEILQLTVIVTDRKGKPELEHKGRLNIPLGNQVLNEVIGENGRTNFGDLTPNNKGDTITVGLQAEGWEIVGDNTFVFTGNPIQLRVKKDDSLGIIKGIVKSRDGQDFIEGAKIIIGVDTTILSDKDGIFRIVLPESMRVKKETDGYKLTVSKDSYKTVTEYYYPKSSDAEIRLEKK